MALEDTTAALVTRIEVTDPGGRHTISREPIWMLRLRCPEHLGYRLREVFGYDHPSGAGFVIVERGRP